MYTILTPSQSIPKAYLRDKPEAQAVMAFKSAMQDLLARINPSEHEEFNKNLVAEFFNRSLYSDRKYMVNTYQSTDLAIYSEMGTHNEHPVVLFEFKGPSRPDMVTKDDLKKKALYELILYYIREEEKKHNTDIKHLVITNCWEYFIFEKKLFYQLFARNKRFVQNVIEADTGDDSTEYIYNNIIKPEVERLEHRLQFVYVDLRSFERKIKNEDITNSKSFIAIYKLFSPTNLLKLPFTSDHNSLNKNFYSELLYIMGVEEIIDDGVHKIKRLKNKRQDFSLVEQAYAKLEDKSGITTDDERFEAALGLVLTWINRILFLKLLESQLVNFNRKSEVKFLDMIHIPDYYVLHDLFMNVMAKPIAERTDELKKQFPDVPYLNSSLFELSKIEDRFFPICGIRLGEMDVYARTVLKDGNGRRITGKKSALDYLFAFLDAYDFGTDKSQEGENVRNESDKLINASVLGLIFEKINGYKDGSFFTPGYITEYICNKTLRRAVIDKFNKAKGWKCQDFEDLKEKIEYGQREERIEANEIINSLRICDPAVGSGHFLVSALNELIAIKSELRVLQDRQPLPKRIGDYDVRVEYDELVVADEDGDVFKYDPSNPSSQRIQETLFEEKRTIIENCLFGVDLNPKSVDVCRLRLWIELLKNAYYYKSESGERLLQTLPNIDINIKCGNSILSQHLLSTDIRQVLASTNLTITKYKQDVINYKHTANKETKARLKDDIEIIKAYLKDGLKKNLPAYKNWLSVAKELNDMQQNSLLFGDAKNKRGQYAKKLAKLKKDEAELKQLVYDIRDNKIYENAFEWRFEIPEVLDDKGVFQGFDVIIGNPPYISLEKLTKDVAAYAKMHQLNEDNQKEVPVYSTLESRGDIYSLFVERGLQVLKDNGLLAYILPNKWMKVGYGKPLRQLFLDKNLIQVIDFDDNQIFTDATTYTCIIRMTKAKSTGKILSSSIRSVNPETLAEDIEERKETFEAKELTNGIWIISSREDFERAEVYKRKMGTLRDYLGHDSNYGIKVGLSKAFNVTIDVGNKLISEDASALEILRPFMQGKGMIPFGKPQTESYLLFIPKGFTMSAFGLNPEDKEDRKKKPKEEDAWEWFERRYPSIARWLIQFKDKASKRADMGDYWWELRACSYYATFSLPKLFYQRFQVKPCFIYDDDTTFCNDSLYFLSVKDKALLAFLCSNRGWWLISKYCPRIQNGYQLIWDNFKQISVPTVLPQRLGELADLLMQDVELRNHNDYVTHMREVNEEVEKLFYEAIRGTIINGYVQ